MEQKYLLSQIHCDKRVELWAGLLPSQSNLQPPTSDGLWGHYLDRFYLQEKYATANEKKTNVILIQMKEHTNKGVHGQHPMMQKNSVFLCELHWDGKK